MSVKEYIKRGLQYIVHGTPVQHITANIVTLPQSELLSGRNALITGGTSGIGKAIAIAFLNAGASVVITGRNLERVMIVVDDLKRQTGCHNISGIELNNADIQSFKTKIEDIIEYFGGKIDILVNNAGILKGNFKNCDEVSYDDVLNTNLKGVFFLSQIIAKHYVDNKINGNILNIVSSSGIRPAVTPYMLSKWGERGLTEGLARLLAPHGIVVNGIAPGPTATSMQNTTNYLDISWPVSLIKRMAVPEEIANMAVILTSSLGRTIIGDIVYMSGGGGIITNEDVTYNY